jgi:hypothetical protein
MEDLRGRLGFVGRWIGGRVEERPGGERDRIDGSSCRGLVGSYG